jgi:hydroxymethylpyrimidine pyrophosphatase-like HAD family hydrolase
MAKVLVFDMDGTIADLYGVEGWLTDLRTENTRPYTEAKPLYDMTILNSILDVFKMCGWRVVVTTWLAKDSTKEYENAVRKAKLEWLEKYNFPYDEIHLVKYGTTKANCTRRIGGYQVLVDDNEQVRNGWNLGGTINAQNDIIEALIELLESN